MFVSYILFIQCKKYLIMKVRRILGTLLMPYPIGRPDQTSWVGSSGWRCCSVSVIPDGGINDVRGALPEDSISALLLNLYHNLHEI